jgi:7-cyano-7-deazaguanine tRNA-ribosyltransferase
MTFETIAKDALGRIALLETKSGTIETPAVMPVINPNKILISPREMQKMGADVLITNAYIIYKNSELRKKARAEGVHSLLDWHKPIMTDSGAYQLASYGGIDVDNNEILEFQESMGVDICVPLDLPTHPDAKRKDAKRDLTETYLRLKEARKIVKNTLLCAPVQGGRFPELRKESASKASEIQADIYAIGGVVPLLDAYRYETLVDVIVACKKSLPPSSPVHLFGAGHPMTLALSVALGCDLFDSAAYALYAKDGRYLTPHGTLFVDELDYLPCSCGVCSSSSAKEMKDEVLLAKHNLYITFQEIRTIKQSIKSGTLWDLVEMRCRAHPLLLGGLRRALKYSKFIEKYDPVFGTFFYRGSESAQRTEVVRYADRLGRFSLSGDVLITTKNRKITKLDRKKYGHIFYVKAPFGPYPVELGATYPIGQSVVLEDDESRRVALENVLKLIKFHRNVHFFFEYGRNWESPLIDEIRRYAKTKRI